MSVGAVLRGVFVLGVVATIPGCGDRTELLGRVTTLDAGLPMAAPDSNVQQPRFTEPQLVAELAFAGASDEDPTLTGDLLEIYFMSERAVGRDLYWSKRASLDAAWDPPQPLTELNSGVSEITPAVSVNGLRLLYWSGEGPAGDGAPGLWLSERVSRDDTWPPPTWVPELEYGDMVIGPGLSESELQLAIAVLAAETEGWDMYLTQRDSLASPWQAFAALTELNGPANEHDPFLFDEARQILFSSTRTGEGDLFWSHRDAIDAPFSDPEPLVELNLPDSVESDPHLALDGSRIYFASTRGGSSDIYEAFRVGD